MHGFCYFSPNPTTTMHNLLHHVVLGVGSIFLAPAGGMPQPNLRITLPPRCATEALGRDFSMIGRDFIRATDRVEHAEQMELSLTEKV